MTDKPKKQYNYKKKKSGKNNTGRPLITLDKLPKDWKDTVFLLAAQGKSDIQIRAALALTWSGRGKKRKPTFHHGLWDDLKKREDEFSATVKACRVLCEAWWQNVAQKNLDHSSFNRFETAAWFINMKNRFGWRDKTEVDHGLTDESWDKYKDMSIKDLVDRLTALGIKAPGKK